jgi:hypothetical protein
MIAKFIVRLLDANARLLAWAEVYAEAKPQDRAGSCPFWATAPTMFVIEEAGDAVEVTIHWADLDVARRQVLLAPVMVAPPAVFRFDWIEPVWLVPGMRDVPLPAVTVRAPVMVSPPAAAIGVKSV